MRRSSKWAVGAVAAFVPVLAGTSPAAAATASNFTFEDLVWTSTGGVENSCTISGQHSVDSDSGDLTAIFSISSGSCFGDIFITIQYVDDHGDPARVGGASHGASSDIIFIQDAGTTAVTVDYQLNIRDCSNNCRHFLQTKTK
jgi:hypothetical protein